jgi:prepilin-type processing-associated H-X9-DG protein
MERSSSERALTRVDLLCLVACSGLVMAVVWSAVGAGTGGAGRVNCANNLRRLGVALLMYSDDQNGYFPPRVYHPVWPARLHPYFGDTDLLRCPDDGPLTPYTFGATNPPAMRTNWPADSAPRSYAMNSWIDYLQALIQSSGGNFAQLFRAGRTPPVPEIAAAEPAQTIALGEKVNSMGDYFVDMFGFDDLTLLAQSRHGQGVRSGQGGGANYAFLDGSARFLRAGASSSPTNLWGVLPEFRASPINSLKSYEH